MAVTNPKRANQTSYRGNTYNFLYEFVDEGGSDIDLATDYSDITYRVFAPNQKSSPYVSLSVGGGGLSITNTNELSGELSASETDGLPNVAFYELEFELSDGSTEVYLFGRHIAEDYDSSSGEVSVEATIQINQSTNQVVFTDSYDAAAKATAAQVAAEAAAAGVTLPSITAGDKYKKLSVKTDESGYELIDEFVNVSSFGAVGDGITDDSSAIQSAINYLSDNGTLWFPSDKSYFLGAGFAVSNKNDITILSNGATIISDEDAVNNIFDLTSCDGWVVEGFVFENDALGQGPNIIRMDGCNRCKLKNNYIKQCQYGIISASNGNESNYNEASGNILIDSKVGTDNDYDINILAYGLGTSKGWKILNNTLIGGNHLTLGPRSEAWTITGNYTDRTNDGSIYVVGRRHIISNNIVIRGGKDGIKTKIDVIGVTTPEEETVISNNYVLYPGQIIASGGVAIFAEQNRTNITGNVIILDHSDNLATSGSIGVLVRGRGSLVGNNIIKGKPSDETNTTTDATGIQVDSDGDEDIINLLIQGNTFEDVSDSLNFEQNNTLEFRGIKISSNNVINSVRGVRLQTADKTKFIDVLITDNNFDGLSGESIDIPGTSNGIASGIISNNYIRNTSEERPIRVNNIDNDVLFEGNKTDGSESAGLFRNDGGRRLNNYSNNIKLHDSSEGKSELLSLGDDSFYSFTPNYTTGIIYITMANKSDFSVIVAFELTFGSGSLSLMSQTNSNVDIINSALTGTTGTDGNISVGQDGTNLYIENREGNTRNISYTIIGENNTF